MTEPGAREPLLVVDDDPGILRALKWSLEGYELLTAQTRTEAIELFRARRPKVVTLDLGLPPAEDEAREGLAALDEILSVAPTTKVIVVSGNDERQHAVEAVGRGAWDFYAKPIDTDILAIIVARAFHVHALEAENRRFRAEDKAHTFGIVTSDAKMLEVCRTIERVAPADVNVLIQGESGTGKELVARGVHDTSERRHGPFVAINCAAIPDTLLESELFGHEKGAFTNANRQVKGKIELASGGTLFLDEIGDMPLALQAKLLRVTQDRVIERIGGRQSIAVDIRIVSATNQDLDQRIQSGQFREDLFYRLNQIGVNLPPLRERGDDVLLVAHHLAERCAIEHRRRKPRFSTAATAALRGHGWPGNIRELENRIRRAVIMGGETIEPADLDFSAAEIAAAAIEGDVLPLRRAREIAEHQALTAALKTVDGNLAAAARLLEISRPTLYNLMRAHGIGPQSRDDYSSDQPPSNVEMKA